MNARKSPGRNQYKHRQQYGVIVVCKDALHQAKTFNQLKRMGMTLRVVVV